MTAKTGERIELDVTVIHCHRFEITAYPDTPKETITYEQHVEGRRVDDKSAHVTLVFRESDPDTIQEAFVSGLRYRIAGTVTDYAPAAEPSLTLESVSWKRLPGDPKFILYVVYSSSKR